jgi:hypothetical protein
METRSKPCDSLADVTLFGLEILNAILQQMKENCRTVGQILESERKPLPF